MKNEEWKNTAKNIKKKNKDTAEKHHMGDLEREETDGQFRNEETVMSGEER